MASAPGRAAASAFAGSAVEYYDFTLFATASALFLGPVFFAPLGPGAETLAALATFGVAFLARPLGAVVFGHLGDHAGRRPALVRTLVLMGAATFGIGALPGYSTIGIAAPILLVALRLLQGLSAGAEQAGANALTLEHAPAGRRGWFAAWTMQGTSVGTLLGKIAFLGIVSLPRDVLLAWGWRVPFLVAGPLIAVAWLIRSRVVEPPAFDPAQAPRVPVREVLADHGGSVGVVALASLVALGGAALNVYGLAYATSTRSMGSDTYLSVLIGVTLASLFVQPRWAALSDRHGRRRVFGACALAAAVLAFPFLGTIASRHLGLFVLAAVAFTLAWSGANAVGASYFGEQFPTRVRTTGTALGTQLGMMLVGFGPTIMTALQTAGTFGWVAPAGFAAACLAVAASTTLLTPETAGRPLSLLGARR